MLNKTLILSIIGAVLALILIGVAYYQGHQSGYNKGYIEASDSKTCGKSESPWKN